MSHIVKVPLQNSDMFVDAMDIPNLSVTYEIREKETGRLMEPVRTSIMELHEGKYHFDNRHIDQQYAGYIEETLN